MPITRLRLRRTADPAAAAVRLKELAISGRNTTAGAGGQEGLPRMRNDFLTWFEQVENVLGELTDDGEVIAEMFTSRYWRIRELDLDPETLSDPRPYPLIYAEVSHQVKQLERMVSDLEIRLARLALVGEGHTGVLDTHVLMHYQAVDQIPWPTILGHPHVRLVIPLRVIEEIDTKKYATSPELAKTARNLLPALVRQVGRAGAPRVLIEGVTIEVAGVIGPRDRPDDADEEILETCLELGQFSGQPVTLVTADTGMLLRAQAHDIGTASLPSNYLRRRPVEDADGAAT